MLFTAAFPPHSPTFASIPLTLHDWNSRARVSAARACGQGGGGLGGIHHVHAVILPGIRVVVIDGIRVVVLPGVHVDVVAGIRIVILPEVCVVIAGIPVVIVFGVLFSSLVGSKERWEKRATTNVVAHFRDALCGPPTYWVPPRVSPSSVPPSNDDKPPTSLVKEEGQRRLHPHVWHWVVDD